MKFSKNRGLGRVANVVLLGGSGIADLQLTGGVESDRLEVWRYGENYEYEIDHK